VQQEYEKVAKLVERLEQENQYLLTELETTKEKYFEEKGKLMKEADAFKHELSELRERIETYKQENRGLISRIADCEDKNVSYENEIVMRTEKLKEKTRQCRTYGEEVSKLVRRIEELSAMSDEIIIENQDLSNRCRELEAQVEEVRTFQSHISRLKGEVNSKKSAELGKLMDSLGRLQNHA
jgi:chromosome segregation ATPase